MFTRQARLTENAVDELFDAPVKKVGPSLRRSRGRVGRPAAWVSRPPRRWVSPQLHQRAAGLVRPLAGPQAPLHYELIPPCTNLRRHDQLWWHCSIAAQAQRHWRANDGAGIWALSQTLNKTSQASAACETLAKAALICCKRHVLNRAQSPGQGPGFGPLGTGAASGTAQHGPSAAKTPALRRRLQRAAVMAPFGRLRPLQIGSEYASESET